MSLKALQCSALRRAVCPAAPFLLPLSGPFVRTTSSNGNVAHPHANCRQNARLYSGHRRQSRSRRDPFAADKAAVEKYENISQKILDFQGELYSGNLEAAMEHYPQLKPELSSSHVKELARLINNCYRNGRMEHDREVILGHAQTLVEDLRKRKIAAHPLASLHLISLFQQSKQYDLGLEFWDWLLKQDETYADARTYGAAIEFLAYYGTPLQDLEELYAYALKRFPGGFSAYHLSPEAILPDRSQQVTFSGTRLLLLQGILAARLVHGSWRDAYMALDTALRLYPTAVPARFFEMFLYERPLIEGYQVFLIACRSGNPPSAPLLTAMLSAFTDAQSLGGDLSHNSTIAKAMLNMMYAYLGAGGELNVIHLNIAVRGALALLPAARPDKDEANLHGVHRAMAEIISRLINAFSERGITPSSATFAAMINMGGKLRRGQVVKLGIDGLTRAGLEMDSVTHRVLLTAMGELQNAHLVEESWNALVEHSQGSDEGLIKRDWMSLAQAARRAGNAAFVEEQLLEFEQFLHPGLGRTIKSELRPRDETPLLETRQKSLQGTLTANDVLPLLAELDTQSEKLWDLAHTKTIANFYLSPISTALSTIGSTDTSSVHAIPEEQQCALYDELTTDPPSRHSSHSQEPTTEPEAAMPEPLSTTGYPLSALRYENWKSINAVLSEAEAHEEARQLAVDDALKAGKPMPSSSSSSPVTKAVRSGRKRPLRFAGNFFSAASLKRHSHSEFPSGGDDESGAAAALQMQQWRQDILLLRGLEKDERIPSAG
ncbi:MAG: hypothetical protein M1819_002458 [Sarea resinae]|nr:MAG: hypothetical protein M1819_002458 [Sarea resinae]